MKNKNGLRWLVVAALLMLMVAISSFSVAASEEFTSGNYTYKVENNEAIIVKATDLSGKVTIPPTLGGYTVTTLEKNSFNGLKMEEIVLPEGLTTIGGSAFWGCKSLTTITIPANVTLIKWTAFYGCEALEEVVLMKVSRWCLRTACLCVVRSFRSLQISSALQRWVIPLFIKHKVLPS